MVPATVIASLTTTAAFAAPTLFSQPKEWSGDEFSNNLFSDLAPLLTLFGEQVTKQFLTMSMGWADNLLLAMGPLGIITVVISAIRVGGVRRLKGLVGRAQESQVAAERELLSSTSDSVCELWSGQEVVRQFGRPDIKEIIIVEGVHTSEQEDQRAGYPKSSQTHDSRMQALSLKEAILGGWLESSDLRVMRNFRGSTTYFEEEVQKLSDQAPNITLNVEGATSNIVELWLWVTFGSALQLIGLLFPALISYHWDWSKGSQPVQRYAYPCFLIGSTAIIVGMILCSHVIEGITVESTFTPSKDPPSKILRVLRIQRACTVSDQTFPSYIIFNSINNKTIRTSRLESTRVSRFSTLAGFSSLLTVTGFISQFVGLRGLHWSATVLQLGITLIMTIVRSWVRRGLAVVPEHVQLTPGYELSEAAIYLGSGNVHKNIGNIHSIQTVSEIHGESICGLITGGYADAGAETRSANAREGLIVGQMYFLPPPLTCPGFDSDAEGSDILDLSDVNYAKLLEGQLSIREKLRRIMPEDEPISRLAACLSNAMVQVMAVFARAESNGILRGSFPLMHWNVKILHTVSGDLTTSSFDYPLQCMKLADGWSAPKELFALITLWLHWLQARNTKYLSRFTTESRPGRGNEGQQKEEYIRLIGSCTDFDTQTLKVLPGWIGKEVFLLPAPNNRITFERPKTYPRFVAPYWPVFGMQEALERRSQSTMPDERTPQTGTIDFEEKSTQESILQYSDLNGALFISTLAPEGQPTDRVEEECIAIVSKHSMATQCALEIFSGFMSALTMQVETLGGNTTHVQASVCVRNMKVFDVPGRHDEADVEYNGERWTNSLLFEAAQVLVDTGLVTSTEEANAVIIPPFAKRGLLPTEPGEVCLMNDDSADGESVCPKEELEKEHREV